MERARPIIAASPVTAARAAAGLAPTDVWPFWPGSAPGDSSRSRSAGGSAALTSGVDLLNGMAVLFGIDRLQIAGVTDGPDTDYAAQARGALVALEDHDVVIVHVESPDEAGHSGDAEGKIAAIEAIDREVVGRIAGSRTICASSRCPTIPRRSSSGRTVGSRCRSCLHGPGIACNGAETYDEAAAGGTGFYVDPGHRVMDLLLE
jgi:2,3-bisphosphoglycerate-independent phosphoglycerate mutase